MLSAFGRTRLTVRAERVHPARASVLYATRKFPAQALEVGRFYLVSPAIA